MSNNLSDLNDHLFAQLGRLSDDSLTEEQIENEVKRAEAIVKVADQVTGNATLKLRAAELYARHGQTVLPHLPMIGNSTK